MKSHNGCYNMPRPAPGAKFTAQAGWGPTFYDAAGNPSRAPIYVEVVSPFDTSRCAYTQETRDPHCAGCMHEAG
jgi:hypothetical protein